MKKHLNGVEVDLTAEEIIEHEKSVEENIKAVEAIKAKEQEKADNQASGNQKLLDLGLTQAEATAMTGYSIPVEDEE